MFFAICFAVIQLFESAVDLILVCYGCLVDLFLLVHAELTGAHVHKE